ncbi:methionine gamma-lyase family protein [Candidatus Obscuribacterales bacterium]|nr:methionine gamma-lyase family protein [Candidatus Obscuribacterales bacterium]MBX3151605.1 methionine gamma-lyase family protein [Candidatus Obscuribacterales bacterium]
MTTTLKARDLIDAGEERLKDVFKAIDDAALANQHKVLKAFREARVTEEFFAEKTGYGIDNAGRDALDEIVAQIFGAEAACLRMQFVSGTHALACAILGNISSSEKLLCLTGAPYDSLEEVLGIAGDEPGSLTKLGAKYEQIDLGPLLDGSGRGSSDADLRSALVNAIKPHAPARIYYLQKSRGYSMSRRTYSNRDLKKMIDAVRSIDKDGLIMVDNCYGEFVEVDEPTNVGADLVAGSLIKNPGGGLCVAGGYIAGKKSAVESALNRLTAPGVGGHMGHSFNQGRMIFQGLFLAPSVVSSALKGAALTASVFQDLGFRVSPAPDEARFDIIQSIEFGGKEKLINFCKAIQRFSPVNAHVDPEPANMPGYQDEIIMAGGTFVEGSTIEFSADGPLRPPFAAYVQGGLSYMHVKCSLEGALSLSLSGDLPFTNA